MIHGQVVEAWVPYLSVDRLVVADDEAAGNPLMRAAMTMAVPSHVEVKISRIAQTDFPALAADERRSLVLLRDVAGLLAARQCGLPPGPLNVGNVHAGLGRSQVTWSVFLTEEEKVQLGQQGMQVTLQAVPTEPAMLLPA